MQIRDILGLLQQALQTLRDTNDELSLRFVIAVVFNAIAEGRTPVSECHTGRQPLPEYLPPLMTHLSQSILLKVRALPMTAKMGYPAFIQMNVEYNGSSSILLGKHLAMIDKRIQILRQSESSS